MLYDDRMSRGVNPRIYETYSPYIEGSHRQYMSPKSNQLYIVCRKKNVLAKIIIPKTHLTMSYIDNELDELAREDFFRLKKVLEIKRKLRAAKDQPQPEIKPRKRKATRRIPEPEEEEDTEKCVVCGTIIKDEPLTEEEKALQEQKLEELKAQISEIMEMTKGLTHEGILATNVNDFLRTAEELKENIDAPEELDFEGIDFEAELEELCLDCRTKYIEEHKRRAAEEAPEEPPIPTESSHVEFTLKEPSKDTIKSAKTPQPGTSDVYSQILPDVELGTFETEEKEIIKVIRVKNDDGTVSEQKKVIKIKREVKTPVKGKSAASNTTQNPNNQPSQTSGKSNPYSGSRTVGHYTTIVNSGENSYARDRSQIRVRSLPITPTSQMSEPVERFCMSSVTLLSTDLDAGINSSSDEYISVTLNNSPPIIPKYTYAQYNVKNPQSYNSLNLSASEKILFNRIYTKSSAATKSQSYNEVSKSKRGKKIKQSVSFSAKETKSNESL